MKQSVLVLMTEEKVVTIEEQVMTTGKQKVTAVLLLTVCVRELGGVICWGKDCKHCLLSL